MLAHLLRCDASFTPPLSSRVDLAAYAEKLVARARRWEAWAEGDLVGLVAVYADASVGGTGFVSNVSVDPPRRGTGVARQLLTDAIGLLRRSGSGGRASRRGGFACGFRSSGGAPGPSRWTGRARSTNDAHGRTGRRAVRTRGAGRHEQHA